MTTAPTFTHPPYTPKPPVVKLPPTLAGRGATTAPASDNTSVAASLTGASRDAYVLLTDEFTKWGLGSLAPKIYSYIQNGYSSDTIALLLQDTPEFQQRFAGNTLRQKAGLAVLSPADYLATEASYRQVMASAGLPATFYDSPSDFANWIGGDVSPTEIQDRVQLATAAVDTTDPYLKQQMAAYYGVDQGQLTSYFLDQTKALPILQKQEQAAQLGAEAARRGLLSDKGSMESYVDQGLTQSQASQGFQQIATELPNLEAMASRFGVTFGQSDEEQAIFGTNQAGAAKRTALAQQESSLFRGSAGTAAGGLGTGYRQT